MTPGVYNIFAGLGDDQDNVLVAAEPQCQQHQTATFNDALFDLIAKLYPTPDVR